MERNSGAEQNGVSAAVVVLLMIWFAATAALFATLAYILHGWVTSEEQFTQVLGHIMWPYVIFALSVPAVGLFAKHLGAILELRNDIKKIPEHLVDALETAERLKKSIEEISAQATNNLSEVLGALEIKMAALDERLRFFREAAPQADAIPREISLRDKLDTHVEKASEQFYTLLEKWNSDVRRGGKVLVVTRGGGNRPELVDRLEDGHALNRDEHRNTRIAEYLREVFRSEMAARRGGVQAERVGKLDQLLEQLGDL